MGVNNIQLADFLAGTLICRTASNKSESKKARVKNLFTLAFLALTFSFLP
jgi:hypothetical protein